MNKKLVSTICVSSLLMFSAPLLADESHSHGTEAQPAQTEKKSGRKKKQFMCKDCGKPEKNCECKGESHGKDGGHDDKKEDKKPE